jgi:hypothetical protein
VWIRNNWLRNHGDFNLVREFEKMGIFDIDQSSVIILRSFHRKLNNKSIRLKSQIKEYLKSSRSQSACIEVQQVMAERYYDTYAIGDTISILMQIDTLYGKKNVIIPMCPYRDWKFNEKKDAVITGVLKNKYYKDKKSNAFFSILITKVNWENIFYKETLSVGSTVDLLIQDFYVR